MNKFLIILGVVVLSSCGTNEGARNNDNKATILASIEDVEKNLYSADVSKLDIKLAKEAIVLYSRYAAKFNNDELAPDYLFKAGEVSMGIGQYSTAAGYFTNLNQKYPDYDKAADCLFMTGFIYEVYLKRKEKAKEIYEAVIRKYPDHHFAADAKASIENLELSGEELIKKFQLMQTQAADSTS